jgi:acyl-CoA synthetase (AMP-forming)/AMP-acid ligase II
MFLLADLAYPDRPAVFDPASGKWLTYRELAREAERLAALLPRQKQLAFCFCRIDIGAVLNYLACLEYGHAVALLDDGLPDDAKRELVGRYRPDVICSTGDEAWLPAGYEALETGSGSHLWLSEERGPAVHPDLTILLSTSGTTGSPRFVRLSAANVRANALAIIQVLGITGEDRAIVSLPFHYSYGMSVLNTHLLAGASLVLTTEGLISARFWEAVRTHGCTSFAGAPYSYQVLKRLQLDKLNVPSLRTLTQAGGKLNADLVQHFDGLMKGRGGKFFVMYGQTEASPRITTLTPDRLPEKLGSAGPALAGGRLQILTADGTLTTEAGSEGELVYTGPNVMMGYGENREDLSQGDILDGVLYTGDLCRLDADGCLFVIGRMKRDAKLFGLRINMDEVEAMLKPHGPTAVISGPDKLMIFCEYGNEDSLNALCHELAARLSVNYRALEFHRVDRIPVKQSGKVDYAALRQIAL